MTLAYLGLYILLLVGVWSFFIVARIHAYKFKNMSTHIPIVTNALFVFLLVLSIVGIILCFFLDGFSTSSNTSNSSIEPEEEIRLEREIF